MPPLADLVQDQIHPPTKSINRRLTDLTYLPALQKLHYHKITEEEGKEKLYSKILYISRVIFVVFFISFSSSFILQFKLYIFVFYFISSRSNSSVRKTSQGGNRGGDERNAALRAVRDLTGTGSRNQSPVRSGDSSRNSPVSGMQTPVEPSLSPNPTPAVDEERIRKETKSTIEEFFSLLDFNVSYFLKIRNNINCREFPSTKISIEFS